MEFQDFGAFLSWKEGIDQSDVCQSLLLDILGVSEMAPYKGRICLKLSKTERADIARRLASEIPYENILDSVR